MQPCADRLVGAVKAMLDVGASLEEAGLADVDLPPGVAELLTAVRRRRTRR